MSGSLCSLRKVRCCAAAFFRHGVLQGSTTLNLPSPTGGASLLLLPPVALLVRHSTSQPLFCLLSSLQPYLHCLHRSLQTAPATLRPAAPTAPAATKPAGRGIFAARRQRAGSSVLTWRGKCREYAPELGCWARLWTFSPTLMSRHLAGEGGGRRGAAQLGCALDAGRSVLGERYCWGADAQEGMAAGCGWVLAA